MPDALKSFLVVLDLGLLHRRRRALATGDVDLAPGVTLAVYTLVQTLLAIASVCLAAYPAALLSRTWGSPLAASPGSALLLVTTALLMGAAVATLVARDVDTLGRLRGVMRFLAGAATGAALGGLGLLNFISRGTVERTAWAGKTMGAVQRIPSMCQGCTTACGVLATVQDGRLLSITGNPEDPNSQGSVCAKGVAGPSMLYDPYRLLYPLKRVGRRGEGQWKRIAWEEAYTEIAQHLRAIRDSGHPEEFAFQQGRNRSTDIISRFLNAFGTPSAFNHRALCSLNRRAAILATIGETDWDLGDYENSRYILNFGCNWAEAHQGHIPVAIRMMRARERGARIVTFETRLSNTAAVSDEWFCVKPGTDGLIALAMANVICSEGLWNKQWFDTWSNYLAEDYARHLAQYTPELAARESDVPAAEIRRIAREFAAAAPRCTTICNRGSHAHWNGFYNDRAITLLNALVGNMGQVGGWCWHPLSAWDTRFLPQPAPVPPRPKPAASLPTPGTGHWPTPGAGMT